jgi:hypothetical protein
VTAPGRRFVAHRGRFQPGLTCIWSGQRERMGFEAVTGGASAFTRRSGEACALPERRLRSSLMAQNTGAGRGTVTMMVLLELSSYSESLWSYAVIDTHVVTWNPGGLE